MRVSVNLATRPFVELRPFFLRLRLLMAALVLAGIALAISAHVLAVKAARQQAELDVLRDQTIRVQQTKLHTEQRMRQPGNSAVLDRAHFLNALFLSKSFSWTAVMMDLENVLPSGVQVTSIEPAVTADGAVIIRLRVAGERDRAVQLVRNLERSKRFLQPRLGSESAQNREQAGANGSRGIPGAPAAAAGPAGVEFEILANYNPLPTGEPYVVGHGRPVAAAEAAPAAAPEPGQGAAIPGGLEELNRALAKEKAQEQRRAAENVRNGYPRDGVVLPPNSAPPRVVPHAEPPTGAQRGGGPL